MGRKIPAPKLHQALSILLEDTSGMERMAFSSIFRASLDAYETAIEWAYQAKPKTQEIDERFLAQAVANLAAALRYLTMLQAKPAHHPDEDLVREVSLFATRAMMYADGKIPSDGSFLISTTYDFADLDRYSRFLRIAILCATECLMSLGDLLCQGAAHDVGKRGGVIAGIARITYYVRGINFLEGQSAAQEEIPDGGAL
jgi:hypothetical protein